MDAAPIVDRIRIIPRPADFLERNVGSSGEVFFSRESNSLRVYSGKVAGGFEIARADLDNVTALTIQSKGIAASDLSNVSNEDFLTKATLAGVGSGGSSGGASVDVSVTAPSEPQEGNIWLNSNTGRLYIYLDDGDSQQWVAPVVGAVSQADPNAFSTITLADSTQFTASGLDNLNLVDGPGIEISTDSTTNTIIISATGSVGGSSIDLTAFDVTQNSASGSGSLSYNNETGNFSYTPPDLSSYLTTISGLNISSLNNDSGYITSYTETDTLDDVTGRGATTTNAINVGDVTSSGTVTADDFVSTGAGTPTITSASTITFDAADATIVTGGPFRLPSLTSTERDELVPVDGDMIMNSTTGVPQIYVSGAGGWNNMV
jgi:hypothetical protein